MRRLSVATKLSPTPALIESLRNKGHEAMDRFLHRHGAQLGHSSTCNMDAMLG